MWYRLLQRYFLPQKQRNQVKQTKKTPTKYHTKLLDTYDGQTHNHSQIIQIGELPSKNLHEDYKPIRQ